MRLDIQLVDTLTLNSGGGGAGADFRLTNGLGTDFHYWGILLLVRGRAVIGTAAATLVPVLSPTTLIERVLVQGNLQGFGKIVLVDLPGSALFMLSALCSSSLPMFDEDNLVSAAGATGTYDFEFLIPVPFCAIGKFNAAEDLAMRTLLPGNAFANPIEVIIRTGGNDSIIDRAATSTVTMTAYGSATGSPTCEIHRVVVRLGTGQAIPGQKYIAQKTMQGPFVTAAAVTNGLIARLNVGSLYTRILLRVGDLSGDSDPALSAVSNTVLERVYLRQGPQKTIRDFTFLTQHWAAPWFAGYSEGWRELIATAAAGYTGGQATREFVGTAFLDFVADGVLENSLNTLAWGAAGQGLELWGNIVSPGATSQIEVITETLLPRRG